MSKGSDVQSIILAEPLFNTRDNVAAREWQPLRSTNDSIGAEPTIEVSEEVASHRQTLGQSITAKDVNGTQNFELSAATFDPLLEAVLCGAWAPPAPLPADVAVVSTGDLDVAAKTFTQGAGDFTTDLSAGMRVVLTGFAAATNNRVVTISKVDASVLVFWDTTGMLDETGATVTFTYTAGTNEVLQVGVTDRSFSMQKAFTADSRFLLFTGMRLNQMSLTIPNEGKVTGNFDYIGASVATANATFVPGDQTVAAATATTALSGSEDVPYLELEGEPMDGMCVQQLTLQLNNNMSGERCVGYSGFRKITKGPSSISGTFNIFLGQSSWSFVERLLDGAPLAFAMKIADQNGYGYTLRLPQLQLTGRTPDGPSATDDAFVNVGFNAHYNEAAATALEVTRHAA